MGKGISGTDTASTDSPAGEDSDVHSPDTETSGAHTPDTATLDAEAPDTQTPETGSDPDAGADARDPGAQGADRRGVALAGALLLACGGLVAYGILTTEDEPKPRAIPTAEVTYEVLGNGTADISYLARSEAGKATVATGVQLPWKKTVQVPLGKEPIVSITLGKKSGQASCTLSIHGKHVQRATAFGPYGRATCTGSLPKPEPAAPNDSPAAPPA
ncbi:hypothetical protein [Streptomyces sp. 8N616]|uniref:hypothetical protein n=1 Tax=Streptomyces sp. 8N616 TaxID=3457414 RepID=UPI003FD50D1F